MTKEKFREIEEKSLRQAIEDHSSHMRTYEARLQAIENSLGNIKLDIIKDALARVEEAIETRTKYQVKDLKRAVIETTDLHYAEKLGKVLDDITNLHEVVEQSVKDYKELSRNILNHREASVTEDEGKFLVHSQLSASFGLIVSGRVTDIQKLLDDLESFYHLTMIYNRTVQFPRKLMLMEDEQ